MSKYEKKRLRKRAQDLREQAELTQRHLSRGYHVYGGQAYVNDLWDEYRGLVDKLRRTS